MTTMTKVRGAAPVAPWLGGKKALHAKIIERIEGIPHTTYVEAFVGMGGVFLRRTWQPRCEVVNDLNGEIVNLFRILQRHYPQLMEIMRFRISSRGDYERLRVTDPATLTDLERAARFLYLQKLGFGGKVDSVFGVSVGSPRFSMARLEPILDAASERLDGVVFECLDWANLIPRYDSSETLFYLDPPYFGGESDYGKGMFGRDQFEKMAKILGDLDGAFILSINDVPEIRKIFEGFIFEEVQLKYTVGSGVAKDAKELFVSNRQVRVGLI